MTVSCQPTVWVHVIKHGYGHLIHFLPRFWENKYMVESPHFLHVKVQSQSGEAGVLWFSLGLVPLPSSTLMGRPGSARSLLYALPFACPYLVLSLLILGLSQD